MAADEERERVVVRHSVQRKQRAAAEPANVLHRSAVSSQRRRRRAYQPRAAAIVASSKRALKASRARPCSPLLRTAGRCPRT